MLPSIPYAGSLMMDNGQNYGIMKTEAVFGFGPTQNNFNTSFNASSQPLDWIFGNNHFQERSFQDNTIIPKSLNIPSSKKHSTSPKKIFPIAKKLNRDKKTKNKKRKSKKINKCIIKFMKGQGGMDDGQEYKGKKRRRRITKMQKMQKKYMMPVILGLLAAKSILIPIALKALAFMSAKGLMLGFFSTVLASVISLKGFFSHPQEYSNRKDDAKTQVEIIQVPAKSEDHVYYDEHYKKGDFLPVFATPEELQMYEKNMLKRKLSKVSKRKAINTSHQPITSPPRDLP